MPLAFQPLTRLLSAFGTDRVLSSNRLQRLRAREWALAEEYASRIPHIPLFQHRTGQDDSALGTCSFAGLEVRPRRLIPTSHPAVSYVELSFRYRDSAGRTRAVNFGGVRLYARIEDPLWLAGKTHSVEAIRASEALRHAYFSRVFALMKAQSSCNRAFGSWLAGNLLGEEGLGERDWLAMIQNFNHDIVARQTNGARDFEAFRTAIRGFDFNTGMPSFGPVSLRLSVRPHQREDGHYAQSVTSVLLGNRRGLVFRSANGRLEFVAPGNQFEKRFVAFVEHAAGEQLKSLARSTWRRTAEERTWGGPGECEAWFHNHDRFILKGRVWRLERDSKGLPQVMGGHRNVAAYCSDSGKGSRRLAVKAVPFESVGDLVRLIQAHQYVHGAQVPALLAQARQYPHLAGEILAAATGTLAEPYTRRSPGNVCALNCISIQLLGGVDWPGARHRLPRHCPPPDPSGRAHATDGPKRRGHAHPEIRLSAESQHPLPHAVSRWGLRGDPAPRQPTPIPLGAPADVGPTDATGPHHRPSGGAIAGTRRLA